MQSSNIDPALRIASEAIENALRQRDEAVGHLIRLATVTMEMFAKSPTLTDSEFTTISRAIVAEANAAVKFLERLR